MPAWVSTPPHSCLEGRDGRYLTRLLEGLEQSPRWGEPVFMGRGRTREQGRSRRILVSNPAPTRRKESGVDVLHCPTARAARSEASLVVTIRDLAGPSSRGVQRLDGGGQAPRLASPGRPARSSSSPRSGGRGGRSPPGRGDESADNPVRRRRALHGGRPGGRRLCARGPTPSRGRTSNASSKAATVGARRAELRASARKAGGGIRSRATGYGGSKTSTRGTRAPLHRSHWLSPTSLCTRVSRPRSSRQ
jgi:hypothetical protein